MQGWGGRRSSHFRHAAGKKTQAQCQVKAGFSWPVSRSNMIQFLYAEINWPDMTAGRGLERWNRAWSSKPSPESADRRRFGSIQPGAAPAGREPDRARPKFKPNDK